MISVKETITEDDCPKRLFSEESYDDADGLVIVNSRSARKTGKYGRRGAEAIWEVFADT
jgi:hypothetical protein